MLLLIALIACTDAQRLDDTAFVDAPAVNGHTWEAQPRQPADTGAGAPSVVDLFVLLDSGASMFEEQHMLADAIPELLASLADADWTLTVVTMDAFDSPVQLTPSDTPADIRRAMLVGVGGPIEPQGYSMLALAMDGHPPRLDATVSLLIVSDGDDFSNIDTDNVADRLGPDAVVSAIVSSDTDCGTVGREYLELVSLMGGAHSSVCEETLTPAVLAHADASM